MFRKKIAEVVCDREPKKTKNIFSEDVDELEQSEYEEILAKDKNIERNYVIAVLDN